MQLYLYIQIKAKFLHLIMWEGLTFDIIKKLSNFLPEINILVSSVNGVSCDKAFVVRESLYIHNVRQISKNWPMRISIFVAPQFEKNNLVAFDYFTSVFCFLFVEVPIWSEPVRTFHECHNNINKLTKFYDLLSLKLLLNHIIFL